MKYMGSKSRHAKHILPIILEDRKPNQWYIEPFAGGFNVIDKVGGKRLANDAHPYLIALYRAIQDGWEPPDNITEEEYLDIRDNKNKYSDNLVGFVGFGCSYSGKWFGGYARGNTSKGEPRNYCQESKRNILRQAEKIKDVYIFNLDYNRLIFPNNSIVYCDPPYANTTTYAIDEFDHSSFWDWCRELHQKNNRVYVSEYEAPDDFVCVWSRKINNSLTQDTGAKQGIERLFIPIGQAK